MCAVVLGRPVQETLDGGVHLGEGLVAFPPGRVVAKMAIFGAASRDGASSTASACNSNRLLPRDVRRLNRGQRLFVGAWRHAAIMRLAK
jgi:hypothetical protein